MLSAAGAGDTHVALGEGVGSNRGIHYEETPASCVGRRRKVRRPFGYHALYRYLFFPAPTATSISSCTSAGEPLSSQHNSVQRLCPVIDGVHSMDSGLILPHPAGCTINFCWWTCPQPTFAATFIYLCELLENG